MGCEMEWDLLKKQELRRYVEKVLHVPGNFTQDILEMAVILDGRCSKEEVQEFAKELSRTLKQQSEVFRNVRLNLIFWKKGEKLQSQVVAMPMFMLGGFAQDWESSMEVPSMEELLAYLKLFQARSKLIFILNKGFVEINEDNCKASLKPFLGKKLIWISLEEHDVLEHFLKSQRCNYLKM